MHQHEYTNTIGQSGANVNLQPERVLISYSKVSSCVIPAQQNFGHVQRHARFLGLNTSTVMVYYAGLNEDDFLILSDIIFCFYATSIRLVY